MEIAWASEAPMTTGILYGPSLSASITAHDDGCTVLLVSPAMCNGILLSSISKEFLLWGRVGFLCQESVGCSEGDDTASVAYFRITVVDDAELSRRYALDFLSGFHYVVAGTLVIKSGKGGGNKFG